MASQNTYTTAPDSNYPRRFPFTFPSLDSSEVYVSVAGTIKTVGASNDYTVGNYNKTSGGYIEFVSDTTRGTGTVRVYRLTGGSLKRDFQAGSAIKADDLNTANKQAIYLAEEARQEFTNLATSGTASGFAIDGGNIAPDSITSNKIKDLEVKAADLSSDTTDDTKRAVTTNHIRDNAVTTAKLAALNVTTAKLANSTGTTDGVTTPKIADGAVTQAKINSAVIFTPVGTVITYAGSTAPTGYLKSNGDTIPNGTGTVQGVTADFSALYAIVGATLPDLRGEFIRGLDDNRGVDSGRQIRSSQTDENKQHNHSISVSGTTSNKSLTGNIRKIGEGFRANGSASGVFTKIDTGNSSITGSSSDSPVGGVEFDGSHNHTFSASGTSGNQGSESRPRNVALLMCIKY